MNPDDQRQQLLLAVLGQIQVQFLPLVSVRHILDVAKGTGIRRLALAITLLAPATEAFLILD